MYDNYPKTQSQIRSKIGEDCFQLLTVEGDDFLQIKGIGTIATKVLDKFPEAELFISSNAHDFGTYYGLEVSDSSFAKFPEIENDALVIADDLGYDI